MARTALTSYNIKNKCSVEIVFYNMSYFVNDMYKSIFSSYIWLDNLSSSTNKDLK